MVFEGVFKYWDSLTARQKKILFHSIGSMFDLTVLQAALQQFGVVPNVNWVLTVGVSLFVAVKVFLTTLSSDGFFDDGSASVPVLGTGSNGKQAVEPSSTRHYVMAKMHRLKSCGYDYF